MADLAAWPDSHEVLRLALADLATRVVGPNLVPDMQDHLPLIQVREIGGTNDDKITDAPKVAVTVFDATYEGCRDIAESIRQRLLNGALFTDAGRLDRCVVEVRPTPMTWPDPNVWVRAATYRLSFRR